MLYKTKQMYTVLSKHYSLGPVFRMLASDQDWSLQARNSYITKLAGKAHSRLNMAYSYTKNFLLKKDSSQVSDVYFKRFSPVSIPVSSGR